MNFEMNAQEIDSFYKKLLNVETAVTTFLNQNKV